MSRIHLRHPIRGLLIGPAVAPVAYWAGVMAFGLFSDFRFDAFQSLRELATIAAFALPLSYVVTLIWGAPILFVLRHIGWLRATTLVLAGAIGGTIVAALVALSQQDALFRVRLSLPAGAVLGALVAGTCWWTGRGKADPRPGAHR